MHMQERVALRAKTAVDAGTRFEKYTYLTNDLLQRLTTRALYFLATKIPAFLFSFGQTDLDDPVEGAKETSRGLKSLFRAYL